MTPQRLTAFALVEQQQAWGQAIHRIDCELEEWSKLRRWQRDDCRIAALQMDREVAFASLRYWHAGVLRWVMQPVEA